MTASRVSVPAAALFVTQSLEGSKDIPVGYAEGFVRIRPDGSNRGSYVEGIDSLDTTKALLERLEWEEADRASLPTGACHPDSRVTYYKAMLPSDLVARTGIIALRDATGEVEVIEGKHGLELTMQASKELPQTTEVWAITGPLEGSEQPGLWSWYPGPIGVFATSRHKELLAKWRNKGKSSLTGPELEELAALPVKLCQA